MSFGRLLLGTFFGAILAAVVGTLILLFILGGIIANASKEPEVFVPDNVILELNLSGAIEERAQDDLLEDLFASDLGAPSTQGLNQILQSLEAATKDDRVKGLYINGATPGASLATLQAIRRAVSKFKAAGKFVVSYSELYTEGGLYVASAGDEVYLYPEGMVDWNGLAATPMFFKGALDKLGIKIEVIKVGTFKSAAEPFSEKKMSQANREQYQMLLDDMWQQMVGEVAESRGVTPKELQILATDLAVYDTDPATAALNAKLIDDRKYPDEVDAILRGKQGTEGEEPVTISLKKYHKATSTAAAGKNRIAVVYAVGEIMMGGGDEMMTPDQMQKAIRKARDDKRVKAIVLRVNSPGGSALASDMIWREVALAREVKPVIASYGDVAASGGYYISAGTDWIVAEATTITGSIGVVGMLPNTQAMFEDKLGITFDRVTTNPYADLANLNRPLTPVERNKIQAGTNGVYQDFVKKVVDGREAYNTFEEVDAIGQGHVWSGTRALKLKLVDELGGLDRALAIAAEKAGLGDDYQVVEYPQVKTSVEKLTEAFSSAKIRLLNYFFTTPAEQSLYSNLRLLNDPRHVYLRAYPDLVIE